MHVVIVGGGFGGVKAALDLAKDPLIRITLISNEPYFLYHATLYSVATGHDTRESVVSLGKIFARFPNVTIAHDTIRALDTKRRTVRGNQTYNYDELILALGVVTSYFGINGLEEHAYGIKTLEQVQAFKSHIRDEVMQQKHLDKHYVVIGAGPTGVELAGALQAYLKELAHGGSFHNANVNVMLVEAAPRILPHFSRTASKKVHQRLNKIGVHVALNQVVESVDDNSVRIDGRDIPSHSVIWTAGVKQHPFYEAYADIFKRRTRGFVTVNDQLMAAPHVYVIGDNASTKYAGLATTALTDGRFVAKVLKAKAHKRRMPNYKPVTFPDSVPVGNGWAYVESHGMYAAGRFGAMARRVLELQILSNLLGITLAYRIWRAHAIQNADELDLLAR